MPSRYTTPKCFVVRRRDVPRAQLVRTGRQIPRANALGIWLPVSHAPSCIVTTNPSRTGLNPLIVHCTGTGTCKEPAMSTFVFFVIILNTPLYKEPCCRKFETPLCSYGSVHTKISICMDAITPGRVNRWNDKKFIDIQCMYLKNQPNFPVLLDEFLLLYYNLIVNKWIIYIRKYLYLPFLWKSNRNIYYQSRLQIS